MKLFAAGLESKYRIISAGVRDTLYNLISYFKISQGGEVFRIIRDMSQLVLIDSGAHSFQQGSARLDWKEFTRGYARWIAENDEGKIVGYFEMDIDNIIGYAGVLELRKILEETSGKIIPVWHKNRGITDFRETCDRYRGKTVAVTGFRNEDIRDEQYLLFLEEAWKRGCYIHCLGMTRTAIIDKVPFDSVDSRSWSAGLVWGVRPKREGDTHRQYLPRKRNLNDNSRLWVDAYRQFMNLQVKYEAYWLSVRGDYEASSSKEGNQGRANPGAVRAQG